MAEHPVNHHWFPRCLMEPWVGRDGKVESFYRHHHKVASSRKSTKRIGSIDNLHLLSHFEESEKLSIESDFGILERRYAIVRDLIKLGKFGEANEGDKFAFALMICLLPLRRADRFIEGSDSLAGDWISDIRNKNSVSDVWDAKTDEERAALSITLGRATYFEAALIFAKRMAHNLCNYEWNFIEFSHENLGLVIADRPFRRYVSLSGQIRYIMPITPNHLFVASNVKIDGILEYDTAHRDFLLVKTIGDQFRQAARFVIGIQREPYIKLAEIHMTEVDQPAPTGTL